MGRYHIDPASGYADVAFVVRDDWQGRGLGTALLAHLVEIARQNGISGFTAEVLATNLPMLHVFHKSGLEIHSQLADATYSLRMPLQRAERAPVQNVGDGLAGKKTSVPKASFRGI